MWGTVLLTTTTRETDEVLDGALALYTIGVSKHPKHNQAITPFFVVVETIVNS